jgi:hypothetical protein
MVHFGMDTDIDIDIDIALILRALSRHFQPAMNFLEKSQSRLCSPSSHSLNIIFPFPHWQSPFYVRIVHQDD